MRRQATERQTERERDRERQTEREREREREIETERYILSGNAQSRVKLAHALTPSRRSSESPPTFQIVVAREDSSPL